MFLNLNFYVKMLGGDSKCYKDLERELNKGVWSVLFCIE